MPATAAAVAPEDYARRALAHYWWRAARARTDFAEFAQLVVKDHLGRPIRLHHMHLSWVWHLTYCWNRGLNAAIWAPFGSGKSVWATALVAWLVGRNKQLRTKYVSNGDETAGARVEGTKAIMETSEYRDVFPGVRPGRKWNNRAAFVERAGAALDPTLHARGVETKGIGGRADMILFDDVVDDLNSAEYLQRKKVKVAVHQKWMSRLDTKSGRVLWICTPWHVDDASHELLGMKNWCTLIQKVAMPLDGTMEQEVTGAGPDYLQVTGAMQAEHERAREALAKL
jgi:hypothetical protein